MHVVNVVKHSEFSDRPLKYEREKLGVSKVDNPVCTGMSGFGGGTRVQARREEGEE